MVTAKETAAQRRDLDGPERTTTVIMDALERDSSFCKCEET